MEDICNPVVNRPKPTVEEGLEVNDQNSAAHNGPTAKQGAEGKGEAKGNQQTKPGTKEMEVDWDKANSSTTTRITIIHYLDSKNTYTWDQSQSSPATFGLVFVSFLCGLDLLRLLFSPFHPNVWQCSALLSQTFDILKKLNDAADDDILILM